jgi:hypothetical protein
MNSEDFSELVSVIRQQYEIYIVDGSVQFLLNLYLYEMIVLEDELLTFIRNNFHKLRYSSEPMLKEKIRESVIHKPEWKALDEIECKLASLKNISM